MFSESRIPNEQDYFYRDIQLAKNSTNSVIYGGSNTVLSREALDEIGGFVTNVITEDFATGMLIQTKGYQCYATDEVHASGLSPEDLENLVKQRRRWARGCIQTGRKLNILFQKGLNWKQKISYLSSIAYWYDSIKRLVFILAPIMFSVFGLTVFVGKPWMLAVFWLPMYLINNSTLKYLSGNIRTVQWTNIYETIMFPLLLGDVLLEMVGISQNKFAVTRKGGAKTDSKYQFKMAIPHILLTILTVFGIVRCMRIVFQYGNVTILFLVFWLIVNLYNLIMAIFFMLGRKTFRKTERFRIEADGNIAFGDTRMEVKTWDISEGGFSILLKQPKYIPPEKIITVSLKDNGYKAEFKAEIVQVLLLEAGWKYAFRIMKIEEEDYKELLHIIHDRIPPLTKYIQADFGFFEDLRSNLVKRSKKLQCFNRKLPRMNLNQDVVCNDGSRIRILSFNYHYVTVDFYGEERRDNIVAMLNDQIELHLGYEKTLDYQLEKQKSSVSETYLYRVNNLEEMLANSGLEPFLFHTDWKKINQPKAVEKQRKVVNEFDELSML